MPDEGWDIESTTPSNPAVELLNGQWDFVIRDREPSEAWYRVRDESCWAWDESQKALRHAERGTGDLGFLYQAIARVRHFNPNLKGLLGPNHDPKPAYHSVREV